MWRVAPKVASSSMKKAQNDAADEQKAPDKSIISTCLQLLLFKQHLSREDARKITTVSKEFKHAVYSALASRHKHSCVFSKSFWTRQDRLGNFSKYEEWLEKNGKEFCTLHIYDFSSKGQRGSSWPQSAVFGSNAIIGAAGTPRQHNRHALLLTQLASPQLRDISLTGCIVQLGPHSGYNNLPGVLHGLSASLTKLQLRDCWIADWSSALATVATLTNLQHLGLQQVAFVNVPTDQPAVTNEALEQSLAQLTKLQRLDIRGISDTDGPTCISMLPYPSLTAQGLAAVQHMQQLTMLLCGNDGLVLTPSTAPYLSALTALQHFEMTRPLPLHCGGLGSFGGGKLEAAVLRSLPQLQHLELADIQVLPNFQGGADLLAALGRMTNLTTLVLANLHIDLPGTSSSLASMAVYTALTASSKLVKVDMFRGFTSRWLPQSLWEHVLPAGRHLPYLQDWSMADPASGQDIARLVNACPGLQRLELTVKPGSDLAALQAATNLQALEVRDRFAADILTSLTGLASLRRLVLRPSKSSSHADLLVVTTLRQLTAFELVRESWNSITVSYTGEVGNDKPVWLQVLDSFGRIPSCQLAVLAALRGLLPAQQQQQPQMQAQQVAAGPPQDATTEIADLIQQVLALELPMAMAGLNLQA